MLGTVHSTFSMEKMMGWGGINGKIKLLSPCLYCKLDSMSFPIRTCAPEGPVVGNCF